MSAKHSFRFLSWATFRIDKLWRKVLEKVFSFRKKINNWGLKPLKLTHGKPVFLSASDCLLSLKIPLVVVVEVINKQTKRSSIYPAQLPLEASVMGPSMSALSVARIVLFRGDLVLVHTVHWLIDSISRLWRSMQSLIVLLLLVNSPANLE